MVRRMCIGHSHAKLVATIAFMEDNLENPVTPPQLARLIGLSSRQLERLFRKYMGSTPGALLSGIAPETRPRPVAAQRPQRGVAF